MKINKKMLFLVVALVTVLILVSATNATNTTDKSIDNTISEKTSTPTSKVVKEETTTKTSTEDKKVEDKQIRKENKTDKNTKEDSITIDGIEYTRVIENQIIDIDSRGIYASENTIVNNTIIEYRDGDTGLFNEEGTLINNSTINADLECSGFLYIYNSHLNCGIYADDIVYIDENTTFGEWFDIGTVNINSIVTNNTRLKEILGIHDPIIIDGISYTNIIENATIKTSWTLYENTYMNNTSVNINGDALSIRATSFINNSNINRISIGETAYIHNSNITESLYCYNSAYIYNSHLDGSFSIREDSQVYIDDETTFGENFYIQSFEGNLYTNNTRIYKYLEDFGIIYGENEINDTLIQNNLNISAGAVLRINNCTINSNINNNGKLIIDESSTIGDNFAYSGNGEVITNNTNIINKLNEMGIYLSITNNKTINTNIVVPKSRDLTFVNCNISAKFTNNGNLTLINCSLSNNTMTSTGSKSDGLLVQNNGLLTMINCTVENNTFTGVASIISSYGNLIMVNTSFINNTIDANSVDVYVPDSFSSRKSRNVNVTIEGCTFDDGENSMNMALQLPLSVYDVDSKLYLVLHNNIFNNGVDSGFNTIADNNVFNSASLSVSNQFSVMANVVSNNIFNQCSLSCTYLDAYNNTFINAGLTSQHVPTTSYIKVYDAFYMNVYNNTFENSSITFDCGYRGLTDGANPYLVNNSVYDNKFTGKSSAVNTITPNNIKYNMNTRIFNNEYVHTSINDTLIFDIPVKVFVNDNISATYYINNPEYYDSDILEGLAFDIYVDDNYIKSCNTLEGITIEESGDHTITIQPSISATQFTQTIEVLPQKDVLITPENIDTYVKNGVLTKVKAEERAVFQGEFNNLGEIVINTDEIVLDGKQATFTNTQFILEAEDLVIQNMNIINTQTGTPIKNTGKRNSITNNNIKITNTDTSTRAIENQASNTLIQNNVIYVDGPSLSIDHSVSSIANTTGILLIGGNKNTIKNNTITVTTSQESEIYGTIEAITVNNRATNTIITENNIKVSNAKFSYGIDMLSNNNDNTITKNNIEVTSYRYTCGIQVGNGAENILIEENQIKLNCHNTTPVDEEAISYGIVTTDMSDSGTTTEIDIIANNIYIDSTVGYGIEVYRTTNTEIYNNTIYVEGAYSMGIGYAHSPNSVVEGNNIRCIGDSTITLGQVTEEIPPETVGIKIQQDSTNIKIDEDYVYSENHQMNPNTIHTYDTQGQDYCINIESENAMISGNWLRSTDRTGDQTIKNNTPYSLKYNNQADKAYTEIELNIPTETIVNKTVQISITLTDEYQNPVEWPNTITLKIDDTTIEIMTNTETTTYSYDYTPTTTGQQEISVNYNGRGVYYSSNQTKILTVNPKPVSHTNTTTENITIGESTTLTATFYDDNDQQITSGNVIFKVNGKTLRDNKGNVIYAEIIDGVAQLPDVNITQEWTKEGTTIQAIYIGDDNNEPITTTPTTVTVTKPEATIILDAPTEATAGTTITLKATVTDGENNITSGRVAFKLNGKTLKDPKTGKALYANVENGIATIQYTIPEKTKVKEYTLTAVFTDTAYDRVEAESKLNVVKA